MIFRLVQIHFSLGTKSTARNHLLSGSLRRVADFTREYNSETRSAMQSHVAGNASCSSVMSSPIILSCCSGVNRVSRRANSTHTRKFLAELFGPCRKSTTILTPAKLLLLTFSRKSFHVLILSVCFSVVSNW